MKDITITKERILEAASKCSQARETLKTLFPEVFEEKKYFNFTAVAEAIECRVLDEKLPWPSGFDRDAIQIRASGEYGFKGFYLRSNYDWKLIEEAPYTWVLVPMKK